MSKFGARPIVFGGYIISAAGYLATYFASSINSFLITYGLIAGCGNSCAFIGGMVPIYDYFQEYKAFALGFIMTGFSVGYFMWPPVVTVLFNHFGCKETFMLLAGVQLNGCVVGALLRPFGEDKQEERPVGNKSGQSSSIKSQMGVFKNKYCMTLIAIIMLNFLGNSYAPTYAPKLAE